MSETAPKTDRRYSLPSIQQPLDEASLAVLAVSDPASFAILYDRYFPRIHKYMLYRVQDPQTADDLVSQTFEAMLKQLRAYRPDQAPFSAWLFGIARHVISDHFRAGNRLKRFFSDHRVSPATISSSTPSTMEDAAVRRDANHRLSAALACLSSRERDVIGLKFASGMNNRQIAALMGLSDSHVGIILYRSLRRLKAELIKMEVYDE